MSDGIMIIWPERRWISAKQIESWFADGVTNNEIDPGYLHAKTTREMAAALSDAGIITLGRGN